MTTLTKPEEPSSRRPAGGFMRLFFLQCFNFSRLAILLVLFFISVNCYSQRIDIKFQHITVDNGLSSNTVNSIIRDTRGFLWIATENGVNRYDGYTFASYRYSETDSLTVSCNTTHKIFEDNKQRIWLGTEKGLNLFNRNLDVFDKRFLEGSIIKSIYQDKSGRLWVGSSKGLYFYDEQKSTFCKPMDFLLNQSPILFNSINTIIEDSYGTLWVGTFGEGIYTYDLHKKTSKRYFQNSHKKNSLNGTKVRCFFEDHNKNMWIAVYDGGLNLFHRETESFEHFANDPNNPESISNNLLTCIWECHNGKIWIGTAGNGIEIYDPETKKFRHLVNQPLNSRSLNNNIIRTIYSDRIGVMWVGTYAGGINFFDMKTEAFVHYQLPTFNNNNSVTSFAEDKKGNIWIGTDGGGICYFNRKTGTFTHVHHDSKNKNSFGHNSVISLLLDRDSILWIGTYYQGLSTFNTKTKKFHTYISTDKSGLSDNTIWRVFQDSKGRIWVGTYKGLNLYDPNTKTFKCFTTENSGLSNNMIWYVYEDHKNRLWVGTQDGLNVFNESTQTFKILSKSGQKGGLSHNFVISITENNYGDLLIGTLEGGINLWSEYPQRFVAYKEKDGLPNNMVCGMLTDMQNNIWISTSRGLAKLNLNTKKVKNYFVNDGLQNNQFNIHAFHKTSKGELLFGGINGFTMFNPTDIKQNEYIPPIALTSFKIFNKEVSINQTESPLQKHISETSQITIPYTQAVVTFDFAALNFIQPEKNEYAYRLVGFEQEWNYVGNKRTATYTNLTPGAYTFQVKGSNNDGVWNNTGTSLSLTIIPPFWETWWFKLVVFYLIILVGTVVISNIRKRISVKIMTNKLIAELKIKALISQMNPHFIFNCLNSIQHLILSGKKDDAMHYLNQFADLLRTVLESSEKNLIPLEMELNLLRLYLELESMRFDNQFRYTIKVDPDIIADDLLVPSLLVQPFIENALWHGLMHKKGPRELLVSFELSATEDILLCKISDNGVGRSKASKIKRENDPLARQSLGIKLIKQRIGLIKKQYPLANLTIVDEVDEHGNAAGTTVILKLPLDLKDDNFLANAFEPLHGVE